MSGSQAAVILFSEFWRAIIQNYIEVVMCLPFSNELIPFGSMPRGDSRNWQASCISSGARVPALPLHALGQSKT
jgi:hypothetical protein